MEGLDYLHRKAQIIHTDIKPENVLVSADIGQIQELAGEAVFSYRYDVKMSSSSVSSAPEDQRLCNKNKSVKLKSPANVNSDDCTNNNIIEDTINNNVVVNNKNKKMGSLKILVRLIDNRLDMLWKYNLIFAVMCEVSIKSYLSHKKTKSFFLNQKIFFLL